MDQKHVASQIAVLFHLISSEVEDEILTLQTDIQVKFRAHVEFWNLQRKSPQTGENVLVQWLLQIFFMPVSIFTHEDYDWGAFGSLPEWGSLQQLLHFTTVHHNRQRMAQMCWSLFNPLWVYIVLEGTPIYCIVVYMYTVLAKSLNTPFNAFSLFLWLFTLQIFNEGIKSMNRIMNLTKKKVWNNSSILYSRFLKVDTLCLFLLVLKTLGVRNELHEVAMKLFSLHE